MWGTIFVLGLTGYLTYKILGSDSASGNYRSNYDCEPDYDYDYDYDYEPDYDYDYDYDYEPDYEEGGSSSYRGYCSHHGGIDDICDSGAVVCNDGSVSPSS